MAKFVEKKEAIELRRKGISIKKIASKLGVSSSSISLWVRDIELTEEQYKTLKQNAKDPLYGKRLSYINKIKRDTNRKIEKLKAEGILKIGKLTKRELFLAGCALYWSEGFKKDSQVGFANSDPAMLRLFLRWLMECFGYKTEDLIVRVTINSSHKYRIREIEKYWSEQTKLSPENFRKPFFQKFTWKKTYQNPKEYFGLLRVKVRKSKDFLRKIHGFIEGLRLEAGM